MSINIYDCIFITSTLNILLFNSLAMICILEANSYSLVNDFKEYSFNFHKNCRN